MGSLSLVFLFIFLIFRSDIGDNSDLGNDLLGFFFPSYL